MKLKPCPLCGSPAKIFYGSEKRWVICTDISLRRSFCLLAGSLVEIKPDLWNRLPRRDPLQKQKDAVVRAACAKPMKHGPIMDAVEALQLAKKRKL